MTPKNEHRRLFEVLQTARAIVSQLELDKVLSIVLRKSMEVTRTKAGSIALYDSETNSMRIHAHRGFSKNFVANREWEVRPRGLTARILNRKGLTVISDTTNKAFFSNPVAKDEGIRSLVCVPLVHHHETVGILYVDDFKPRTFSKADLEELEILASFASVAIHHARTHVVVKHQAVTDGLTGLFNRRYFEDLLIHELQRAKRHYRALSLALVDVNDFKQFNDRYGHPAGDAALAALGEAVRISIRSTDLAARYGGDELAIILPETTLQKAYQLFSKRVKQKIEEEFKRITRGRHTLTVTIGLSSWPQDGKDAPDIVLAADRALLAAKKHKEHNAVGVSRNFQKHQSPRSGRA